MLGPEERPDGTIKVHFADNTYKTLPLKYETPVSDVIELLCRRVSASGGRHADPSQHELFIIAPGSKALRERRLLREDKPLQIQAKGGSVAFKFLFREIRSELLASSMGRAAAPAEGAHDPSSSATAGDEASIVPVSDVAGRLRMGPLERLLEDGTSWHECTVILDEDRLWFSLGPSDQDGSVGGGMASVLLCDCDRVLECEDKRLLQLVTKEATLVFRTRSTQERNSWLLAVVKQAALIKERDILLQAERILASMECRRSTKQLSQLEAFGSLQGILAMQETRDLFSDFVRGEYAAAQQQHGERENAGTGGDSGQWPAGIAPEELLACLERQDETSPGSRGEASDSTAWAFAEGQLFARFEEHPVVQSRLCRIAAGIA